MALLDKVFGGGVGELVQKVVGTFKLSPEAKQEFELKMAENASRLRQMDVDLEVKLTDVAGQNIRAEAAAGRFTAYARPMFMYVIEAILVYNYIIAPIFKRDPILLPSDLLVLFGFCIMGYIGGRTYEKIAMAKFGMNPEKSE
jgi:hypothetical protein